MPSPYYFERNSLTYFRPRGRSDARASRARLRSNFTCNCGGKCPPTGFAETKDRDECCKIYGDPATGRCYNDPGVFNYDTGKFEFPGPIPPNASPAPTATAADDPFSQMWASLKPYFEGNCDWIPGVPLPPCGFIVVGGVAVAITAFALMR